jgi:hypothetical protein
VHRNASVNTNIAEIEKLYTLRTKKFKTLKIPNKSAVVNVLAEHNEKVDKNLTRNYFEELRQRFLFVESSTLSS